MRHTLSLLLLSIALLAPVAQAHDHATMMQMAAPAAPLPGDSLQRLSVPLRDQADHPFTLADEHGPATLMTMFYGDCQIACPIILEGVKRTVEALPAAQRAHVHVVLVSLNPGVDTPATLEKLAQLHDMPAATYRLAVAADDAHTRMLAAALGVKYRRLANGEINHSTRVLLVDAQGRIVASSDTLSVEPDPALVSALQSLAR